MKKILITLCAVNILFVFTHSVFGAIPNQTSTDRKLKDLSNRFSNLESTWGRFQIGGDFELDTTSSIDQNHNSISPLGFNQQLKLFLDAFVDQNLQLSLRLTQSGLWGGGINSTINPFQVDEAFLRLSYPESLNYLGRFRFSLGPLGISSDFFYIPVEGFALQKAFKNFHAIAVYSRTYTEYNQNDQIDLTYDYFAARIGWSNPSTIIGLNIVPKGGPGEQAFSIDWAKDFPNIKVAAELAMYSLKSDQSEWNPGALVSIGKNLGKNNYIQLKAGYFTPEFTPYYSSISRPWVDKREWFIPNSQGIELYLRKGYKNGYELENRLIALTPIENSQPNTIYRWRSSLNKNFSQVNQLQVGIDLKSYPVNPEISSSEYAYNRIFANWNIRF